MSALFEIEAPVMRQFDPGRCYVREINYGAVQQVLSEAHYIGKPGATSFSFGIYADHMLGGVLTWGTIPRNNAESICGPEYAGRVMELTRLALYDWLPANAESWFIAQVFRYAQAHIPRVSILVSYADPSAGHVGTIYQATNWLYTGASTNDYVFVSDVGEVSHPRTTGRMRGPLPSGGWRPSPAKHRYVTFLGSRTQRHHLRSRLRWPVLPFPKCKDVS